MYECEKFLHFVERIEGLGRKYRTQEQLRKGREEDDRGRKEKKVKKEDISRYFYVSNISPYSKQRKPTNRFIYLIIRKVFNTKIILSIFKLERKGVVFQKTFLSYYT